MKKMCRNIKQCYSSHYLKKYLFFIKIYNLGSHVMDLLFLRFFFSFLNGKYIWALIFFLRV